MTLEVDEFLAHYGVSGMRWGVRRASPIKSQTKRRVGAASATVAGGVAGGLVGKKALESGAKFLTSKKLNDKLVNQILKEQPKLVQKMARKHVSNTLATKANTLVSELTTGRNKTMILAGSALVGALLIGGGTLATVHAIQNRNREKREELDTRR